VAELQIRALRKTYPGATAPVLHGIDLQVAAGEFMVFVGPSGCGKSTLLRAIAGLEPVDGGDILLGGASIVHQPPAERGVAMVFQSYALYPHLTVAANLGFPLKMQGLGKHEIRRQVNEVAQALQIEALLDRLPKALSGGQRQRVAIGRAIVRRPKVFLFDEPLSNLDAALRVQMRLELARLHRELGTTMVYVTHDQVEAMTLGQRIAVFNGGRLEQVGRPLELFQAPDNLFVAGFLGAPRMNFIQAELRGGALHTAGGQLPCLHTGNAQVQCGVRPEHWLDAEAGRGLAVDVDAVEHLGDVVIIHGRLAGSGELLSIKRPPSASLPHAGQRLWLQAATEHLQLFGPDGNVLPATL
jgi:multiple sugar transport system ATP-binding protein